MPTNRFTGYSMAISLSDKRQQVMLLEVFQIDTKLQKWANS